ncbi:phosphatase PAP2 family protein [Candidatus Protochlamydia phocaeensis]|uniref:phosphatase PAP2 family protein n=1 Tax=Candidatus Protochlamydia phocaeensis TaxID=1414722 RepID=UPI000838676E|nr:phosphatase PAP2 family protein [Candidatus Protochlamydia phocaeensis]
MLSNSSIHEKKSLIPKSIFSASLVKAIGFPLLILALLTPWSEQLDLKMSGWFYQNGHFSSHIFFEWVYYYGLIPGWIVVGLACLGWILSFLFHSFRQWRRIFAYLILVLAIGSGLIVHVLLKDHWGRPRPKQTTEFGGQQSFRAYYHPNFFQQPEPSKSFPCGHCSMGFYFFTFILLGRHYRRRFLYLLGLALTGGLGGVLSLSRLAQGGHFFSDIVVSAIIMWLAAFGLYHFMFRRCHLS